MALPGGTRERVTIHLPRVGQARVDRHGRADRDVARGRVELRIISHRERHRKRGTAGDVHEHLTHVRAGVAQIHLDRFRAERRLDQLSAPSAQWKHFARIRVGTDLQTIEIGCLGGIPGIAHDDVVVAGSRKGDLDSGIESEQRRVFAARDRLAVGVENLEQRIDGRSRPPRFHFDHALVAGFHAQAEQVALGPAQRAVQREGRRRQLLRVLQVVIGVGEEHQAAIRPR